MLVDDAAIEKRIDDLRAALNAWAQGHGLHEETTFRSWQEQFEDEPLENPCVLVMLADCELAEALSGFHPSMCLYEEFEDLVASMGFEVHADGNQFTFHAVEETTVVEFREYFEWKWVCGLVASDYADLYHELFEHFAKRPEHLRRLHWRKFEQFLDSVFRNSGYESHLGPGGNDGGVDLRIYRRDAIGDVLTLVQVKRNGSGNPVKLGAVQALVANVDDEHANRGLFVTTSRFLPSAKRFAARKKSRIELATSDDVAKWCKIASGTIVRDKSKLVSAEHVQHLLTNRVTQENLVGAILYATHGYNCTDRDFCLVLKDAGSAVLLMRLPCRPCGPGSTMWCGLKEPLLTSAGLGNLTSDNVFRATRQQSEGREVCYWGQRRLYSLWNGQPLSFDLND